MVDNERLSAQPGRYLGKPGGKSGSLVILQFGNARLSFFMASSVTLV